MQILHAPKAGSWQLAYALGVSKHVLSPYHQIFSPHLPIILLWTEILGRQGLWQAG